MNCKLLFLSLIIFSFFLFSSCSKYWYNETDAVQKHYNLSYGKSERQRLDLFIPKSSERKNTIIFIVHGGAWIFGKKWHLRSIQNQLTASGYTTVNLNYRLASRSKKINYKHQLKDIEAAFSYFNQNSEKFHLQPAQKIILGESAGGHLALLYAYQNPQQIDKVISFSGPTDFYSEDYQNLKFYHWYTKSAFSTATGDFYRWGEEIPLKFKEASPLSQVADVPTLLFQGTWDFLVHPQQAKSLNQKLEEKNVPHRLVLIKGAGHLPRFNAWWRGKIILPEIINFIENE